MLISHMRPDMRISHMGPNEGIREQGRRIRAARKAAGLTQAQVADGLHKLGWTGADQSLVSRTETGQRPLRSVESRWFAQVLGEDPDAFDRGHGVPGEPVVIPGATAKATAKARSAR
jgi:transcriptional regulator with XRE-family HTH domain